MREARGRRALRAAAFALACSLDASASAQSTLGTAAYPAAEGGGETLRETWKTIAFAGSIRLRDVEDVDAFDASRVFDPARR
jgi:hypothetical protein